MCEQKKLGRARHHQRHQLTLKRAHEESSMPPKTMGPGMAPRMRYTMLLTPSTVGRSARSAVFICENVAGVLFIAVMSMAKSRNTQNTTICVKQLSSALVHMPAFAVPLSDTDASAVLRPVAFGTHEQSTKDLNRH